MKIAFLVGTFPGLSETFILNQITGLLDMGHDVQIFAQFNPKEEKVHEDIEIHHLMERVHYFDMPSNRLKRILKALYLLITNFNKAPAAILRALNIFKYGKQALSLRLFYTLLPFIGKESTYHIIHCHFGPNGIFGVLLKELGIKGKIITTFHGYDMSVFISSNGNKVYKNLFLNGDLFLPISDCWRRKLVELGCDVEKIMTHHVGIDLEKFKYSERKIQPGEPVKILTVGRLVEKKGHEYAIKAVAKVIAKHRNVIYAVAGDGPLRNRLEDLVLESGIENYVQFLGAVEQDEVLKLLQNIHIFLLPSATASNGDMEGIPVSLMEAMATGMPAISTYHSGIPELIQDGKSGFLVPERDVNTLAEKLEYLIEHPEQWPEMGRFGRKFVEENYDIKRLNRQLADIYKKCLAK